MRLSGKIAIITGSATGLQGSVMGFGGAAAWRRDGPSGQLEREICEI